MPGVPIVHPRLHVSDFINNVSKEWNVKMLEDLVHPKENPLIRSFPISQTTHGDSYCWTFIKNDMYIVKSR